MRKAARLLIYTDEECASLSRNILDWVILPSTELDKIDAFKLGNISAEFQYNMRIIKRRVQGYLNDLSERDVSITDWILTVLESYEGLIDFICDKYDSDIKDYLSDKVKVTYDGKTWLYSIDGRHPQSSIAIYSYDLTEEQKQDCYKLINKL